MMREEHVGHNVAFGGHAYSHAEVHQSVGDFVLQAAKAQLTNPAHVVNLVMCAGLNGCPFLGQTAQTGPVARFYV